ncbi:microsomal glutathione S-transferase 1-like [Venturia canescens]|uniref:microsomal glutathione S-transferase 1-like n=1 Tax=Venturia canescens TaxID=32260 RepID=UPI001C9D43A0|nr:microsomal glutathione S-transferase 1-like [Venturia canescens]
MEVPTENLMKVFTFWSAVLVLKLLAMVPLTGRYRFGKRIFAAPEDCGTLRNSKVVYDDPDIERVRRCHRNDLENILPWFIGTYVYLGTNPSYYLASMLIRIFALSRIAHTLSYVIFQTQPSRAIAFFIGYGITAYQAIVTMWHYM